MKGIETWQNGKFIPNKRASIPIWDAHSFFGWCVFEAMRTYNKKVFMMSEHITRLFKSAELADIPLAEKYSPDDIKHHVFEVLEHNEEHFPDNEEIRIMIFASPGNFRIYKDMGKPEVRLTINVTTTSRYAPHIAPHLNEGFTGVITHQKQIPARFLDAKIKSCSRLHYGIAEKEASRYGEGTVPILLDEHGNVAESSGGNIVILAPDRIKLPYENDMLRGCTLEAVKQICKLAELPIEYGNWTPYDLINSEGALFTSTFYGIIPCTKIIYRGEEFPIFTGFGQIRTNEIIRKFNELVGLDTWKQWGDWYNK